MTHHLEQTPDTGAAIAAVNAAHAAGIIDMSEETTMTNHINGVRVYEMNDCEWVVARSEQEAQAYHKDLNGEDDSPRALTARELDSLQYHIGDSRSSPTISFRQRLQQLVDAGESVPQLFATTEF
ncbi:hypothetical protein JFK97_10785 [Chromobacterium phragmitis]|uniref:hypothetical protein n=1 Tax=Chromobacterium amazonense TaxID=1382803 RepID=UPI0021B824D4|nr:hypothetical protein [Chromobacterium amazonense]MBM2884872.1 hypothetical protein [Chromobacterium amazonense]